MARPRFEARDLIFFVLGITAAGMLFELLQRWKI